MQQKNDKKHLMKVRGEKTMARVDDTNDIFQTIGSIDKLIHEPARLMIVTCLSVLQSADFLFLMRQTGLTKGNLSSHLSKLETAGYVKITKKFEKKIPRTYLSLSHKGWEAFDDYLRQMKQLLSELS
jgi:DNA-binding transcriptional ArsR family regulator